MSFDPFMPTETRPSRPADRLPEPYRSRLLSCLNSIEIDGMPVSEDTEECEVQRIEHDLANGGRERSRRDYERRAEAMKNSKRQIPFIKVPNPLPHW